MAEDCLRVIRAVLQRPGLQDQAVLMQTRISLICTVCFRVTAEPDHGAGNSGLDTTSRSVPARPDGPVELCVCRELTERSGGCSPAEGVSLVPVRIRLCQLKQDCTSAVQSPGEPG